MADVQYSNHIPNGSLVPPHDLLSKTGQNVQVTPLISQEPPKKDHTLKAEDKTIGNLAVSDQLFGSKRRLKVVVIGAGVSGLNFFKRAEEQGENLDIVCYEKNNDIGGTWLENRYPGCACKLKCTL